MLNAGVCCCTGGITMYAYIAYVASDVPGQPCTPADCVHRVRADFKSMEELLKAWKASLVWVWHPVDHMWDRMTSINQLTDECRLKVFWNDGFDNSEDSETEDSNNMRPATFSDMAAVLADLNIELRDGDMMTELGINQALPALVSKAFDITKYDDESEALGDFMNHLEVELAARGVPLNQQGGYWLRCFRESEMGRLSLPMRSLNQTYEGSCDLELAPYGVLSVYRQARMVVDVMQPQALQTTPQDRLPAFVLKFLAATATAVHPVLGVLTDTARYTLLELRQRAVIKWTNLDADTALHFIAEWLKKASSDIHSSVEHNMKMTKVVPEDAKEATKDVLEQLHNMCRGNTTRERLDAIMSSLPQEEQFDAAVQWVLKWRGRMRIRI